MTVEKKKFKKSARNALIPDVSKMQTEFGTEFVGDEKRAAQSVETRVKTNAQRYGYFKRSN